MSGFAQMQRPHDPFSSRKFNSIYVLNQIPEECSLKKNLQILLPSFCHECGAYHGTVLKLLQLITHLTRQPPQPLPLLQSCTDPQIIQTLRARLHTVFTLPWIRAIWDLAPPRPAKVCNAPTAL